MVVDFDGRILAQADPGPGAKIVVAEIDIGALRAARQSRLGLNPLPHLRVQAYRSAQSYCAHPVATFRDVRDLHGDRSPTSPDR
jgi:hypothetical protein